MACAVLPQGKPYEQFERGVFKSDDSFSVDRLVASCQQRAMPALPGAGRILVPYFSSPEECVNETLSKGKGDSVKKRKKSGKKALGAEAISPKLRDNSPVKPTSKHTVQKLRQASSQVENGNKNVHAVPVGPPADPRRTSAKYADQVTAKDLKVWAGPSYYTSPPPELLPMPTSFLLDV